MTSRELDRVARRFADQQSGRFAALPGLQGAVCTVTGVSGSTVTLSWRGGTLTGTASCASYTPAAGDRVLCLLIDSQLIVIDQLV
ncbi:MAG: hypothetical protein HOV76_32430 [Hamadaea sp.]|nr:hypothetical protein [Hamadaea sp.]